MNVNTCRLLSKSLGPAIQKVARRTLATETGTIKALLYLEHREGKINPGSLNALTAATALGGDVVGIVTGDSDSLDKIRQCATKLPLHSLIVQKADKAAKGLAEPLAPLIVDTIKSGNFTHVVAAHTALGKNVFPRVAGLLDVAQVSDVQKIVSGDTFERPIYAGNAVATVRSKDSVKILTIRTSAFDAASSSSSEVSIQDGSASEGSSPSTWVGEELTVSSRPDLGSADKVVSGGRALKSKDTFDELISPLADVLGAAIGASRAAVDSGYADNSLQVGQTGKVVAPSLYLAVGISGAIQHLAGMKDAKVIASINKDADAPLAAVADYSLVEDLFKVVPELTEKLQKK